MNGEATKTRRHYHSLQVFAFLCALVPLWLPTIPCSAQTKKIKEFAITDVSRAALDRLGNLYLVLPHSTLRKYDTDGNFLNEVRLSDSVNIASLEPWNPLRIFIYDSRKREVLLLDRFLAPLDTLPLDPSIAIEPALASPLPTNSIWILDRADNSLKKSDPDATHVLMEITLDLPKGKKPQYTYLREYQNQLFLIDRLLGVSIFSVVGKAIRNFPVPNLGFVGFLGEEIYYLDNGRLKFYDLYSEEQREVAVNPQATYALVTDERMIVVMKDKVEVWEYKP